MSNESADFLEELQTIFLQESAENLASLEQLFLQLENDRQNHSLLEKIFRIMHTMKGSGNAVGFTNLGAFAHHLENLLVKLVHKEISPEPAVIDVMLLGNDTLKRIHTGLLSNHAFTLDATSVIEKVDAIIDSRAGARSTPEVATPKTPPSFGVFADSPTAATAAVATSSPPSAQPATDHTATRALEEGKETWSAAKSAPRSGRDDSTKGKMDESIRLPLRKIDDLLNNFGEQVILQAILEHAMTDIATNADLINKTILSMGKITYDLQHTAIGLRMVTLGMFFSQMRRTARDTAQSLHKPCAFTAQGEDTELDKSIVDNLSGVIVHLIRNAIDHGLESPEIRRSIGKPAEGVIRAEAHCEGSSFILAISDDGGGLNTAAILETAIKRGIVRADQTLTEAEIHDLIFMSGFSTKQATTDVSGRGVGMDAVKSAVEDMRGNITVTAQQGVGTTFTIKLPLNMAIFNGMLLRVSDKRYVIPSSEIKEVYRFNNQDTRDVNADEALLRKGERTMPLIDLTKLTRERKRDHANDSRRIALIISKHGREFAIEVDDIIGQQRIVQKRLGQEIENMPGLSGGAILGDGGVALILNLNDLINANRMAV